MKRNMILIIAVSLSLIACSTLRKVDSKKKKTMTNNTSDINFLRAKAPSDNKTASYHLALTHGYLVLRNNCFYLAPDLDSKSNLKVLIWPWDYSLKKTKKGLIILNGEKNKVAEIGQHIKLGGSGGEYPVNSLCYQKYANTSWVVAPINK